MSINLFLTCFSLFTTFRYAAVFFLKTIPFLKYLQRKHAIRVYKHALDIYENRNWFKAQDHLNFVTSRLNYNLKNLPEALAHINRIMRKKLLAQKATSYFVANNHNNNIRSNSSVISTKEVVEFMNETNVMKDFIIYCNASNSLSGQNKMGN